MLANELSFTILSEVHVHVYSTNTIPYRRKIWWVIKFGSLEVTAKLPPNLIPANISAYMVIIITLLLEDYHMTQFEMGKIFPLLNVVYHYKTTHTLNKRRKPPCSVLLAIACHVDNPHAHDMYISCVTVKVEFTWLLNKMCTLTFQLCMCTY